MTTSIEQGTNGMRNGAQQTSDFKSERESEEMSIEQNKPLAAEAKDQSKGALTRLSDSLKSPTGGATIAGAIGLGAATVFGVVETLVGAGAAYGVYRLVCKRQRSR